MHGFKSSIVACAFFLATASASFTGQGTFFSAQTSTTACGTVVSDADIAVAINSAQFNVADCGKTVQITANGVTANAVVADSCPPCALNGLDLTKAAFEQFAPLSAGLISVTWDIL